jgi:urea transporter
MLTKQIDDKIPAPASAILRGVGQVFFQENSLTGVCFILGLAASSPLMATGAAVGSAIGLATARVLKFDDSETLAGIYGFNATLVGIASFFFFQLSAGSVALMVAGCIVATVLTRLMRQYVPFPTYTTPFIVTTWGLYFLGHALNVAPSLPGGPSASSDFLTAAAHGVTQVMFQASLWTAFFFLLGIALSDWRHALWVAAGAIFGTLLACYHVTAAARTLDPERLVERALTENIALGLYGYNATLAAVALFLWRRSLIPPMLGILISVPLTESFPLLGLPALTAPFVLATWIVLAMGRLDSSLFKSPSPSSE